TFFALAVGGIAGIYYGFHIYTTFRYFVGGLPTLPGALPLAKDIQKFPPVKVKMNWLRQTLTSENF
ncbi:hypothetical protein, partial [Gemmiger formicilis]|uniref:hypothetical protein n=1 Tax=Gemmiger formicilis TaxID=745368 RepID=UPI00195E90D3